MCACTDAPPVCAPLSRVRFCVSIFFFSFFLRSERKSWLLSTGGRVFFSFWVMVKWGLIDFAGAAAVSDGLFWSRVG